MSIQKIIAKLLVFISSPCQHKLTFAYPDLLLILETDLVLFMQLTNRNALFSING